MGDFFGNANLDGGEDLIYELGFKSMLNKTVYSDPMRKIEKRNIQDQFLEKTMMDYAAKANTLSGLTTPTTIDAEIIDRTQKETPIWALQKKVTNKGKTADYNAITARGAAAFKAEGAALADADDTYTAASTAIKFAYSVGGVTGPAQAVNRGYVDLYAQTIRNHQLSLTELLEQTVLTGNASTNALEFSGMQQLFTTNTSNKSAADITLDDIGTQLDAANEYGKGRKIGITDFVTYRKIKSQMMADVQYIGEREMNLAWGLKAIQFEDMPIIGSRFMPTTTNQREFFIEDMDVCEVRELLPPTFEEKGKVNDSQSFWVKWYGTFICKHEARCARIYNIKG